MHTSRYSMRVSLAIILASTWMTNFVGCASFSSTTVEKVSESLPVSSVTEMFEKEEPVVAPKSLAVVWTTTVLEKQAAEATRGFGGVVTFYDADQDRPVRVHGDLTIYAYDEHSRKTDNSSPDRKYVFTREQLEKHYGDGPTGPTYHIWVPWDRVGGPRQDVSLILRFDPAEGKAVMSNSSRAVLPGANDNRDRIWASHTNSPVMPVSHDEIKPKVSASSRTESPTSVEPRMKVTTLDLPNGGKISR